MHRNYNWRVTLFDSKHALLYRGYLIHYQSHVINISKVILEFHNYSQIPGDLRESSSLSEE